MATPHYRSVQRQTQARVTYWERIAHRQGVHAGHAIHVEWNRIKGTITDIASTANVWLRCAKTMACSFVFGKFAQQLNRYTIYSIALLEFLLNTPKADLIRTERMGNRYVDTCWL